MTNPAPHGQVPEALRLADALECRTTSWPDKVFAAAELRRIHARIAELEAQLESIRAGGVNSPLVGQPQAVPDLTGDSVTAPADGANWQDISTAPKDGTRFVAVGNNYGLYSEKQHTCIAQWFRGCWMELSDWNEASELKYLTHWMPLPPPPGSAARAPADSVTAPAGGAEEVDKRERGRHA